MDDLKRTGLTRRGALAGLAGGVIAAPLAARAQGAPVALNVIDVAGNLQLTQSAIERFRETHPELVSRISFSRAPSPELPAKLRAQQAANRVDIDLVLTGPGALSDGIGQGLWTQLLPAHAAKLPDLDAIYSEPALEMQRQLGAGQGIAVVYSPSGPLLEYMPDRLKEPPRTAAALVAYAKANPGRFTYARPVNSGPGWTFLMGLPYILNDRDPKDPKDGWTNTWAYLKELGTGIDYYPTGTGATMKELGEGTRDLIVSTFGWDINPRAIGVVPKAAETYALENTTWVADTQFMVVPKGVPEAKLPALLALMSYLLTPEAQAGTYDKGYFYPGPAVKDVPLSTAPAESRAVLADYGRPGYDALIASRPAATPLTPERLTYAFRRWDEEVGAAKTK